MRIIDILRSQVLLGRLVA